MLRRYRGRTALRLAALLLIAGLGGLMALSARAAMEVEALEETERYLQLLGFDPGPVDGVVDDATRDAIRRYYEFAFITDVEPEPSQALLRELRGVAGQVETLRAETKAQAEIEAVEAQDWLAGEAIAAPQVGPAEAAAEIGLDAAAVPSATTQGDPEPAIPELVTSEPAIPELVVPEPVVPEPSPMETGAGPAPASPDEAAEAELSAVQEPETTDREGAVSDAVALEGSAAEAPAAPAAEPEAALTAEPFEAPLVSEAEEVLAQPDPVEGEDSPSEETPAPKLPLAAAPDPETVLAEVPEEAGPAEEEPAQLPAETPAAAGEAVAAPATAPAVIDAGASDEESTPLPTETPSLAQEEAEEEAPEETASAAASGDDAGTTGEQLARLPAASPAPAFDQSPSALYSRGMDLFRTGDYESAIAFFKDALNQDPSFAAAYQLRGASYEAIGQLALALKDFDTLISLTPGSAAAYNNRCWVLARSKRLNEALADCNQALSLNPYDSEALHSRGYVHEKLGLHERAKMDYSRAYQLNPNDRDIIVDARRVGIIE